MAAATLGNRIKVSSATTGTGTLTLGSAVNNSFCTFAEAGIANGATVTYLIEEGNDFEIGRGVYTSSGTTLTRATVLLSKISGTSGTTKMTLGGTETVSVVDAAEDHLGRLLSVQVFTASGTWTKPAGCSQVVVEVIGGGGSAGGSAATGAAQISAGSGAGAGGYSKRLVTAPGATETVTVGAGGAATSAGNNNGSDGGTSSFGSWASATGGVKGVGNAAGAVANPIGGGGGTGSSGDVNQTGGAGTNSIGYAVAPFIQQGVGGTAPGGGSGGTPGGNAGTGGTGGNYGGGGSGAYSYNSAGASAGGAGANGIVIVWEYS